MLYSISMTHRKNVEPILNILKVVINILRQMLNMVAILNLKPTYIFAKMFMP